MPPPPEVKSTFRDVAWPALPDDMNAGMLALQYQYEETERWPADAIEAQQFRQIEQLLAFAAHAIPFWRERLRRAGLRGGQKLTRALWSRLPVLTWQDALAAGVKLHAPQPPQGHGGKLAQAAGTPFVTTNLARFFQSAIRLRQALWHDMAMAEKLAVITPGPAQAAADPPPGAPLTRRDWGEDFAAFATGPAVAMDGGHPPAAQLAWLLREDPAYLMTDTAGALRLARLARESDQRHPPGLRAILTDAGPDAAEARRLWHNPFSIAVITAFGTEATGLLALQCPAHTHLHAISEHTRLHAISECAKIEILNDRNQPCAEGETGRLIATPLHNFAMPLLRFDTGALATLGGPCSCGRTLPVLAHIQDRAHAPPATPLPA